jgi:hypothetical protein
MKHRYLSLVVLILFLFSVLIAPVSAAIPLPDLSAHIASPAYVNSINVQTNSQAQETGSLSLIGCPVVPVSGIFSTPQAGIQPQDFLIQGTCVEFDQRSEDGQWIRIQSGEDLVSRPGWVAATNILLEQPVDQLPVAASASGNTTSSAGPSSAAAASASSTAPNGGLNACLESVNSLNVRSGPGIIYPSVGYLLKGSCMTITARTASTTWVKSDKGWMAVHYLQVEGDLSQLPIP